MESAAGMEDAKSTLYHRQHVASCIQHDWECLQPSNSEASCVEHGAFVAYRYTT